MFLPAFSILEYVRKTPPKDTFVFRLLDSRTMENYCCYPTQSLVLSFDIPSIYYCQDKTSNISTRIQEDFSMFCNCHIIWKSSDFCSSGNGFLLGQSTRWTEWVLSHYWGKHRMHQDNDRWLARLWMLFLYLVSNFLQCFSEWNMLVEWLKKATA
jgi:hypothetical protein